MWWLHGQVTEILKKLYITIMMIILFPNSYDSHLFISITILFSVSQTKVMHFLSANFPGYCNIKVFRDFKCQMYQNYIGNKKFPPGGFWIYYSTKMLSNDPKISFLWIFSGLILFWVKSTRLDNIFISNMHVMQIM